MDAQSLRYLADQIDRRAEAISRLAWCYDCFLEFNRDGRSPTLNHDGTVAMDAPRSLAQLEEAINVVLGRRTDPTF